ncbi:30S ribosomal protein S6 [Candidatus Saccharibacteria bacterium 32-49-12]|nr:MAG: 30S ribosomal protein S6 [Candidatus Saccharibacteria bacterium 32-49-12]
MTGEVGYNNSDINSSLHDECKHSSHDGFQKEILVKEYELTVLIHPDLETDLDAPLTKVRDIITGAGGKIIREDNWGKKKLAYAINKQDFAVYVYMDVELPADAPLKISNTLNITEEVIRYLLVKVDLKARKALAEQAADAKEEE